VQGAEVLVGAGLVEPEAEAIAGVERLRLEVAGRTDDEMRLLIVIDPGHLRSDRDRQALRFKREIADLDLGVRCCVADAGHEQRAEAEYAERR
jgi:hypothetical protein